MHNAVRTVPAVALAALLALSGSPASASDMDREILRRLQALEENQKRLEAELAARDARIRELEQRQGLTGAEPAAPVAAPATPEPAVVAAAAPPAQEEPHFGRFQSMGRGFTLADTPNGDVNFSLWSYVRYLNQQGLDNDYTDSFGREIQVRTRDDLQVNKVNLTFKGWLLDPDFRYWFYTWTSNTSQGDSAQVVVAGNLSYRIDDMVDLGFGIGALPGTRSLRGTFPLWTKVDTRPMADEFFRPSYTTGVWSSGQLADTVRYKLMVGNNMSQLGVNATQLDGDFDTWSGALWWMPTTGEYGPNGGWGDFEHHEQLATTFGISATSSKEDRQSQPDTEDIENSQIRLSDGTVIFRPNAFNTDGRVNEARYRMLSLDAGMKYRGFNLDGEYYSRWVDDFSIEGDIPVDDLFDQGFQVQTGYMVLPRTLQVYLAGSKVYGEYGNPWDVAGGLNWYPFQSRQIRVNGELLYLEDSPVGYSSVPFTVGGNGTVLHTNLEMYF